MTFWEPLFANLAIVAAAWLVSVRRRNVTLMDMVWPLLFFAAAVIWFDTAEGGAGQWLVLALVAAWAARLFLHLARRTMGAPEDHRYTALRQKFSPGFWWKSLFIVFLLQGALAWLASWSIYGALSEGGPSWTPLAVLGVAVAVVGLSMEAVADWQLAAFKADSDNEGQVMDAGLWRYSRHPNYFGECCFWWGIYFLALGNGAWWTVVSPLLMTVLLLRVSGVSMMEKDIHERRPSYRRYQRETNAFIPGPPKSVVEGEV